VKQQKMLCGNYVILETGKRKFLKELCKKTCGKLGFGPCKEKFKKDKETQCKDSEKKFRIRPQQDRKCSTVMGNQSVKQQKMLCGNYVILETGKRKFLKELCKKTCGKLGFGPCKEKFKKDKETQCKDSKKKFRIGPQQDRKCSTVMENLSVEQQKTLCKNGNYVILETGKRKRLQKLCKKTCGKLGVGPCKEKF